MTTQQSLSMNDMMALACHFLCENGDYDIQEEEEKKEDDIQEEEEKKDDDSLEEGGLREIEIILTNFIENQRLESSLKKNNVTEDSKEEDADRDEEEAIIVHCLEEMKLQTKLQASIERKQKLEEQLERLSLTMKLKSTRQRRQLLEEQLKRIKMYEGEGIEAKQDGKTFDYNFSFAVINQILDHP